MDENCKFFIGMFLSIVISYVSFQVGKNHALTIHLSEKIELEFEIDKKESEIEYLKNKLTLERLKID
jgi:hypothetical protein